MKLLPGPRAAAVLLCLFALPVSAASLDEVLGNFDRVQRSIQTISAEFQETTVNLLLAEPLVAEGRFYMTKPSSIRWEYVRPEPMRFVIADDRYTGYYPDRKQAETRDIRRWSERIFRFIGLGQASDELQKFYDISLADEQPQDGRILLLLEPRKKRVRKRVESVRFWLDARTWLPARVEYLNDEDSSRVIDFRSIQLNPDLAAQLYQVELPPDVQVVKGFGGLPGLDASAH